MTIMFSGFKGVISSHQTQTLTDVVTLSIFFSCCLGVLMSFPPAFSSPYSTLELSHLKLLGHAVKSCTEDICQPLTQLLWQIAGSQSSLGCRVTERSRDSSWRWKIVRRTTTCFIQATCLGGQLTIRELVV